MLKNNVEKIVLGCTHYPYLSDILKKFASENMFINPAKYFAQDIYQDLKQNDLISDKKSFEPKFFVTSNPEQFMLSSKLFYNVQKAEEISITIIPA